MDKAITGKLESFFSQFRLVHYPKGQIILQPGDFLKGVYYLKEGYVKFYSISQGGYELTLNIFKPGSYFSMMWAIGNVPNAYIFKAITDALVWQAPREEFLVFLKKDPEVLFELTSRAFLGLSSLLERLEYLLFGDAYKKVASVLLMAARRFGRKGNDGEVIIQLALTHQEIANLANLARETASIQLKKMERKGLVVQQGHHIVVKSLEKLQEESLIYQDEISLPYVL